MNTKYILGISALIAVIIVFVTFTTVKDQQYGSALPSATALFETSLQARISTSDTSMTLVANSVRGGGALFGYNCFTLDEGLSTSEFVCGSVAGTSVTSLERGLSPADGVTLIPALKFAHRAGADVKITDFPLLERLRDQANGSSTYPYKLSYASEPTFTAGTDIIDKTYADALSFAGVANASTITKGISQIATALQAASSTATGSSGALLVLPASIATSSPGTTGLWSVMTTNSGKIAQSFLDVFGTANTWTAVNTFNASALFNVAPTFGSFSATSTSATSTVSGNLQVVKNATTTNLFISGTCVGCSNGYELKTQAGTVPAGIGASTVTVNCTAGKKVVGGGYDTASAFSGTGASASSYPGSTSSWVVGWNGNMNGGSFTAYAICVNP